MSSELAHDRKGIQKERTEIQKDGQKRLENAKKVVRDKRITSKTAGDFKGGTTEGLRRAGECFRRAGIAADKEHTKQGKELTKKNFDRARRNEKALGKRADDVKQDTKRTKQAEGTTSTQPVKVELKNATRAAEDDKKFLDTEKDKQVNERKKSEKKLQEQEREINRTRVEVRKK